MVDFEGSISPWVMSGSGAFYTNNGNYPHGGTGYMYFGVNNNVSGQTYQTVTIPIDGHGKSDFLVQLQFAGGYRQRRMISCTSKSATPAAHCFKLSRPTATGTKPRLETTRRNRLALLLTGVRLSDCNSVARLIFALDDLPDRRCLLEIVVQTKSSSVELRTNLTDRCVVTEIHARRFASELGECRISGK